MRERASEREKMCAGTRREEMGMYWIMAMVLGCYGALLLLARKEQPPEDVGLLLKPFYRIAAFIYKQVSIRFPRLSGSRQVEADLAQLHPGEAKGYLKTDYYVKKTALSLAVVFVGTLLGGAVRLGAQGEIVLGGDGSIPRGEGEGSFEITVAADYEGKEVTFRVPVEHRRLTREEAERLFGELMEKLPRLILGANESLEAVSGRLRLEKRYEGYPFSVEWNSSNLRVVSAEGDVYPESVPRQATLSARLAYGEYSREGEFSVTVIQPVLSAEEELYRELEQLVLQTEEKSREEESFRLPGEFRGKALGWHQVTEDNSIALWMGAIAAAAAVYMFSDRDLHGRLEKRRNAMKREYPEMVHKLALFVGAGMTVRGAFQRMAGDYAAKRKEGGDLSPVYEELLYTCRELHSGISEGAAYEHFGRRTGLQEYIRLSTLLTQNLKRGNSMLLGRLREEADRAADERLQQSRKLGEEAGTKLLIPMVMMLAVVMVIIMIPAFSGM